MQKFEITVPVQLPNHLMIIEVEDYNNLKKNTIQGQWWSMDEVLKRLCISRKTFTEKILYNPNFKKELQTFVHYPRNKGEKYYFLASKTIVFLEENFSEIIKEL